jgi:hypothetical protein
MLGLGWAGQIWCTDCDVTRTTQGDMLGQMERDRLGFDIHLDELGREQEHGNEGDDATDHEVDHGWKSFLDSTCIDNVQPPCWPAPGAPREKSNSSSFRNTCR